jgi:hypothetical protein
MDAGNGRAALDSSVLAATTWPREYRYSASMRWLIYACAALMGIGGVWMISHSGAQSPVLMLVALALLALAGLIALSCSRSRLILRADSIQTLSLFGSRQLRREAIAGRRQRPTRGKPIRVIVPKQGRPLALSSGFPTDRVLDAWYAALPDLDLLDRERSEALVAADPTFGRSAPERLARLASARQLAKVASMITIGVLMWVYVYPQPYVTAIAIVAVLPWCAVLIAGWSHGLICFDSGRNDVRPNLAIMLFGPALLLGARAMMDVNLLDLPHALEFGFLAGLPLVLAASLVRESGASRAWVMPVVMLVFLALPYGAGALVLADVQLDHQPAENFQTQVLRKYITSGKHRTPYLVLAPWGPKTQPEKIAVDRSYYVHVQPDSTICMRLHRGALGLAWYGVDDCQSAVGGAAGGP